MGDPRVRPVLLLAAVLAVLVACLQSVAPAFAATGDDWRRTLNVVEKLRTAPPTKPVVLLFGGSAARECTHSDARWARQVAARGGPSVITRNLGSSNQSFAQNTYLVERLPQTPMLIFIGITYGRFTRPADGAFSTALEPVLSYRQHRYSDDFILSPERKRRLVREWLSRRYPAFKRNYVANLEELESLIQACLAGGHRPVLLDLPRNMPIIRHALDTPMLRWRRDCRRLASQYGLPWVNFVAAAKLANRDFYDVVHLVEPGRTKWQRQLSDQTVALLERYGIPAAPP
jgi:hypothetical protein